MSIFNASNMSVSETSNVGILETSVYKVSIFDVGDVIKASILRLPRGGFFKTVLETSVLEIRQAFSR